ncbi:MAG: hypothetical protein Q9191_007909 [Dirinaria sp. TL-2023a]
MEGSDSAMDSSLSSHASSEFGDEVRTEEPNLSEDVEEPADTPSAPPAKKQRLGQYAYRASTATTNDYDAGELSSDTSGSIPSSPRASGSTPEDDVQEQVTVCRWLGCEAGDLGNMDTLVQHVHDDHIGVRQKKYACDWEGCPRLGLNHASGYALRAHMRSHTREKPFFCALPVHETEALRPSDPIPRNHSSAGMKPQRLKLVMNTKPRNIEEEGGEGDVDDDATIGSNTDTDGEPKISKEFDPPAELGFTADELAMPIDELYKLSRYQVHWSEEAGKELQKEVAELEGKYKAEWQKKELVLDNLMEMEVANADYKRHKDPAVIKALADDLPKTVLPINGPVWWREGSPMREDSRVREENAKQMEG